MKFNMNSFLRSFLDGCFLCGIIQYVSPPAEGTVFPIWVGWSVGCVLSGFMGKSND